MEIPNLLIEKLKNAKRVGILTGAGVSAESGIKTYRDPDGIWNKLNPAELASMDGFMANPDIVWEWYQMRLDVIKNAKPNKGHIAMAEMENMFDSFNLITQNIDKLHQAAGSKKVYELHGNIIENYCMKCKKPYTGATEFAQKQVPKCPECGGYIRPAVVWFGEMLPADALNGASDCASKADVFFTIGTSAEVYPAANLPLLAKDNGAYVVEVNPNKTSITSYLDLHISAPSGEAMPLIVEKLKSLR
jgi:NAD-dependent deacetylase